MNVRFSTQRLALIAEHAVGGNAHVLEEALAHARRKHADRVHAPHFHPRRFRIYEKGRDRATTLLEVSISLHKEIDEVGLGATARVARVDAQHPVIAIATRTRLDAADIAAAARVGQADTLDRFARKDAGAPA
jgi:hypothetical protein